MKILIYNGKGKGERIMNIGLDIYNVISSFDNALLKEYLKHDKQQRNIRIINKKASM